MTGFFDLTSPNDLLGKLARELVRMQESPANTDHAFNFFVTAEHLLDWTYPKNKSKRNSHRNTEAILKVTWDLASGAKHFKLFNSHKSVRGTKRVGGFWAERYWAEGYWAKGWFAEPTLVVELSGDEAAELGEQITAIELAEKVYSYWSKHIGGA